MLDTSAAEEDGRNEGKEELESDENVDEPKKELEFSERSASEEEEPEFDELEDDGVLKAKKLVGLGPSEEEKPAFDELEAEYDGVLEAKKLEGLGPSEADDEGEEEPGRRLSPKNGIVPSPLIPNESCAWNTPSPPVASITGDMVFGSGFEEADREEGECTLATTTPDPVAVIISFEKGEGEPLPPCSVPPTPRLALAPPPDTCLNTRDVLLELAFVSDAPDPKPGGGVAEALANNGNDTEVVAGGVFGISWGAKFGWL